MKRFSLMALAVIALAIGGCSTAPQLGGATFNARPALDVVNNQGCSGTVFGNADLCYDSTNAYATYYNNGGTWSSARTAAGTTTYSTTGTALTLTNGGIISQALGTGTLPTATCSGGSTGVSLVSGSTDNHGEIVTSSSASTNCTITFNHTFPAVPFCVTTDANASVTPVGYSVDTVTATTLKFDFASATSKTVAYICF